MKLTCSKLYPDFPFAHRQPNHKGHCRFVHGHNWSFEFTFAATDRDECGFVIDFGGLAQLKSWLTLMFDHTTLINQDDPELDYFHAGSIQHSGAGGMYDLRVVPDCSCEGLAILVAEEANKLIHGMTNGRASVCKVTVFEDSKNSATYRIPPNA